MSKTKSTSLLNRSQRTTESSSSSKNQSKQQPSTSSTTSSTSIVKRKNRKNITLGLKLEIIKRLENGESNSSICHEYNLPSSTVSTIRSKKEQIKAFCKNDDGDGTLKNQYYQITYPRNNIIIIIH
ncbi:hypothetical protein DERP_011934 [Dermatophagoides pteronyssinus]|uniref:HTH psq-type domain-containing protein n=1 Tax=Dermatophagoides pteronyssinus TaxID=6956 RepID=A0ABQ8J2M4_DERPT|nr:hypothetical protein DERP_011934 [Dermatophagoides pteronyssinus]